METKAECLPGGIRHFGESDYRCHGKDIADGIMPIYFELISAAKTSSVVSHCVIRWSEGKLEGMCVCACVLACVSTYVVCIRALRGEQWEGWSLKRERESA